VLRLLLSLVALPGAVQGPFRTDSGAPPVAPPDSGTFRFTPLLAPAYNPEMQFLIAGGALMSWKTGLNPLRVQRSTLSSTISLSTTGAVNLSVSLSSFWHEDKLRVNAALSYKDMPDNYWGVGFDAGIQPSSGDATTKYHREWFKFAPQAVWGVAKHFLIGGAVEWNRTIATDVNPTMAADPAYQQHGADNRNNGIGGVLQYDSRDVAANAWTGVYAALTAMSFGGFMGGQNVYQTYLLDYRQYLPLGRAGRTLAWQIKSRIAAHDVPWPELSLVGTGYDLRGYVEGRFRDRVTLIALTEYRQMFMRSNGTLSRHGFVTWLGAGALGADLQNLHGIIPNGGVGYRLELHARSNVRVDVGFGRNSSGVYFNFTEAF
jgi:hypothetical protein